MRSVLAATLASLRRLIFYAVLPGLLAGVVAWYALLPPLAERMVDERLAALGLEGLTFRVAGIGPERASIREVSFAGGRLVADEIALDYDPRVVATGRADRLTVTGFRWRTRLVDGRLDLSDLAPLLERRGGGGAPGLPVSEIVLRDGEVVVDTDAGPVSVPVSGILAPRPPALISGELAVAPHARIGSAAATVTLDADLAAGRLDAFIAVTDGAVFAPGIAAFGVTGDVDLHAAAGDGVTASAYVEVAELASPLGPVAARATAAAAPGRIDATLDLSPADRAFALAATATAWLGGAPRLELAAELTVPDADALARRSASLVSFDAAPPRASLALDAEAAGLAPLLAASRWDEALALVSAHGRLEASLPGASLRQGIEGLAAQATAELDVQGGIVTVASDAISMYAQRIHGEWLSWFGAGGLAPYLDDSIAIGVAPRAGPLVRIAPSGDGGATVRLSGDASIALGTALVARAGADAVEFAIAGDGTLARRAVERAELVLDHWRGRPLGLAVERARIELSGEGESLRGRARVAAAGTFAPAAGVAIPDTRITLDAGLSLSGDRLVARLQNRDLAETGALALPGPAAGDVTLAPMRWRAAESQQGPLLAVNLADGAFARWQARLALVPEPLRLAVPMRAAPAFEMMLEAGELRVAADGAPGGARVLVELSGARAEVAQARELLPGLPLRIAADDVSATASLGPDDAGTVVLEVARLAHQARRPALAPFALSATARREADGVVALAAGLREGSGNVVLDLTGRHDPARGQGQGELTLHPILFVEGGFQPGRLSPYFAPRLGLTTGTVSAAGPIAWSDAGLVSEVVVAIEDLTTSVDEVDIAGVNAAITFDRLLPPSTPPGQIVALAGIDLGLPLTDGLVWGRIDKTGAPLLERSEWNWAGGQVATSFTRRPETGEETLVLEVDGIRLDQLLELTAQGDNIEATGILFGRIPVVFRAGEFVIVDGWLESSFEGGEIHYGAGELAPGLLAGGGGVDLLLEALDDFRYSRLRIDLTGLPDGQTEMRFRIRGANPELYGGAEIEFNMSVTGRLEQIIRQSYEAYYEVPEEVARRLARQARRIGREPAADERQ